MHTCAQASILLSSKPKHIQEGEQMKYARRLVGIVFIVVALMNINMIAAQAIGPNDPEISQLAYLDRNLHVIGPNSSQIFRFDYALKDDGSRPLVFIRMPNGTYSGVNFQ